MLDNRFPKCLRLLRSADYKQIYESGNKKAGRSFQVFYRLNSSKDTRFGISVGRRLGKAVTRNKVRRWIREVIRNNKECARGGFDIIVHPKVNAAREDLRSITLELQRLFLSLDSQEEIGPTKESHPD
jgi:ribonuclease P protein component